MARGGASQIEPQLSCDPSSLSPLKPVLDGRQRADVVALTIELGGIVSIEEDVEELIVADLRRVISNANRFGVPRVAAAHSTVIGCRSRAARVAAGYVEHAFELLEGRFGTPKTA